MGAFDLPPPVGPGHGIRRHLPGSDGRALDSYLRLRLLDDLCGKRHAAPRRGGCGHVLALSEPAMDRAGIHRVLHERYAGRDMNWHWIAAQCVMCYRTAAAQQLERSRVLNMGIAILLVPPILVLALILFLAFRKSDHSKSR